jgi:hypothetical protein
MRRLLALALLVLALAGCGSEGGGDPRAPADTGPATTEQDEGDYPY